MFVVIFEVQPKRERWDDYLDLAKELRPKLEAIDGFIDNELFQSQRTEGRLLSLSTWRDEKAVVRWRTQGEHHAVQEKGRFEIFEDYRIRVGEVTEDSAPPAGLSLDQQRLDATVVGAAKAVSITEFNSPQPAASSVGGDAAGLIDHEVFESIYNPGKLLLLASWRDDAAAAGWRPPGAGTRHRRVRVIRDYGLDDRREAPQFYSDVRRVG